MHIDFLWRREGAGDQTIASVDAPITASKTTDAGPFPGEVDALVAGAAVPAHCGDLFVLRLTLVSGSRFEEFSVNPTMP